MKKCFLVSGLVLAASGVLGMRDDPMYAGYLGSFASVKEGKVQKTDIKEKEKEKEQVPLSEFDSESFKTVKKNDIEIVEKFLKVIVEKEKQALMHKTNTEMLRRIGGRNHNVLKVPEKSELIGEYREYAEKINKVKERSEELRDRMEGFKNWYEKSIENLKARELM